MNHGSDKLLETNTVTDWIIEGTVVGNNRPVLEPTMSAVVAARVNVGSFPNHIRVVTGKPQFSPTSSSQWSEDRHDTSSNPVSSRAVASRHE